MSAHQFIPQLGRIKKMQSGAPLFTKQAVATTKAFLYGRLYRKYLAKLNVSPLWADRSPGNRKMHPEMVSNNGIYAQLVKIRSRVRIRMLQRSPG